MRCSRMKLADRNGTVKKYNRHVCRKYPEHDFTNKLQCSMPCPVDCTTEERSVEEQAYLTILNLMLPPDAQTLANSSGLNLERWSKKRSLLRSASKKSTKADMALGNGPSLSRERTESPDKDQTCAATITNIIAGSFGESSDDSCSSSCHSEEIDPDIRKLLEGQWDVDECEYRAADEDASDDNLIKAKNKARRKRYEKKCSRLNEIDSALKDNGNACSDKRKTKKKRTITISLSELQSPQTTQIIRVDVTSNLSIEEDLPETSQDRAEPSLASAIGNTSQSVPSKESRKKNNGKKVHDFRMAVPCHKLELNIRN